MAGSRINFHNLSEFHSPGKLLIFNYYQYDEKYYHNAKELTRHGTKNDVQQLAQQFIDLDFDVQLCNDLTKDELLDQVEAFTMPNMPVSPSKYGCSIVIVLTHGRDNGYLSAYDQEFQASEIWEPFKDCPHLKGKPKIFIFQACRSKDTNLLRQNKLDEAACSEDVTDSQPDSGCGFTLPHAPDFLLAYSTVEGMDSFRDVSTGSWYIKALTKELPCLKRGQDLLGVLTKVHERIIRENRNYGSISVNIKLQQTPIFVSFLNKIVVLKKLRTNEELLMSNISHVQRDDVVVLDEHEEKSQQCSIDDALSSLSLYKVQDDSDISTDDDEDSYSDKSEEQVYIDLHDRDEYLMDHERRGTALILRDKNHNELSKELSYKLSNIGFNTVKSELVLSSIDIIDHIKSNSQKEDDCFLVAILLQLDEDPNSDINDIQLTKTIINLLSCKNRRNLAGCPKICFIMENPDKGRLTRGSSISSDANSNCNAKKLLSIQHSDFLFVKAYSKEAVNKIREKLGCSSNVDLVSWLTICLDSDSKGKVSHVESSLRYKIYFRKGTVNMQHKLEKSLTRETVIYEKTNYKTVLDGPVDIFYHRLTELSDLENQIQNGHGENIINILIMGPPGVGKTLLAKKFILKHKQKFLPYIWWIYAVTEMCIIESLLKICNDYKVEKISNALERIEKLYISVASSDALTKQILVFDNLGSYTDIKKFLPPFKVIDKFFIVVTSVENNCPSNYQLNLGLFSKEESLEALKQLGINKEIAKKLYTFLGGNPLVIMVAARFLMKNPEIFAKQIPIEEIIVEEISELNIDYNKRIENIFDYFLEKVERETGKPDTVHSTLYILSKANGFINTMDLKPFFRSYEEMMNVLRALISVGLITRKEDNQLNANALNKILFKQEGTNVHYLPIITSLFKIKCEKIKESILQHIIPDLICNVEQRNNLIVNSKRKQIPKIIKQILIDVLQCKSNLLNLPNVLLALYGTTLNENKYILKFFDENLTDFIRSLYNSSLQLSMQNETAIRSYRVPITIIQEAWIAVFALLNLQLQIGIVNKSYTIYTKRPINKSNLPTMQEVEVLIKRLKNCLQNQKEICTTEAEAILAEMIVIALKILTELSKFEKVTAIYKILSPSPSSSQKFTAVLNAKILSILANALQDDKYNMEEDILEIESLNESTDFINDAYIGEYLWDIIVYILLFNLPQENMAYHLLKLAKVWLGENTLEVEILKSLVKIQKDLSKKISDILHNQLIAKLIYYLPHMKEKIHCIDGIAQQSVDEMLFLAAEHCSLDIVKYLFQSVHESQKDKIFKEINGCSVLHVAAKCGNLETLRWLSMQDNVRISEHDLEEKNLLYISAREGKLNVMQWILENSSSEGNKKHLDKCLQLAARNGFLSIIEWLVNNKGADIGSKCTENNTILHIASKGGYLDIVKWIKLNACTERFLHYASELNNFGDMPINSACWSGKLDIVDWFVRNTQVDINKKYAFGNTLLRSAVWGGHLELAKWLVKKGADILQKDKWGNYLIHKAAEAGHLDVTQWLYENDHLDIKNREGWTATHAASSYGRLEIIKWLVGLVDITIETKCGDTVLHLAAKAGHFPVVKCLIKKSDSDLKATNRIKETPLHCATYIGHLEIVKYLIKKGSNIEAKNDAGETPLHIAVRQNRLDIIKHLISKGAKVKEYDSHGNSLLHKAANYRRLEILSWLLKKTNINIDHKNKYGRSVLCQPYSRYYFDVVEILLKHKAKTDEIENFEVTLPQATQTMGTHQQSSDSE